MLRLTKTFLAGCLLTTFLAACPEEKPESTGLLIAVVFDSSVTIDQLRVTVTSKAQSSRTLTKVAPDTPRELRTDMEVMLIFPPEWDGDQVVLNFQGTLAGAVVAQGAFETVVNLSALERKTVSLASTCSNECRPGESECVKDMYRTCQSVNENCTHWSLPAACPKEMPFCSNGVCDTQCTNECPSEGTKRCVNNGYQTCGQHDSDTCLDWGPISACQTSEICVDGACVPECDGKPCSCKAGETQVCPDVGQCKGGLRNCKDSAFGACEWQVGPAPETCDGVDNDCNNTPDDNLVPQACEIQIGVCKGSLKRCDGKNGWLPCTGDDYKKTAQAKGLIYEAQETLCDGQDNDCDGKTDEAAECCKPQCAGKACGAPDGCGHKCQTGSCGSNGTCQSGACQCTFLACGSNCCSAGQVCNSGACCTPECNGRQCGKDPKCGVACGTCNGNATCSDAGTCEYRIWKPVDSGTTAHLNGIYGTSASDIWSVGDNMTGLHWDGTRWTAQTAPDKYGFTSVWAAPNFVIAGGTNSKAYRAANGGWAEEYKAQDSVFDVFGLSSNNYWIVDSHSGIYHFENGKWSVELIGVASFNPLNAVWGTSPSNMWAVGEHGQIFHRSGNNWISASSPTNENLTDIWGSSENDIWAVGYKGVIIHWNGQKWSKVTGVNSPNYLYGIWGSSKDDVWIVGGLGTILHYNGKTWGSTGSQGMFQDLLDVWGTSSTDIWAVGRKGVILHYQ